MELLCEVKVDDIDLIAAFANAHQEVIGLDVTMYEVTGVNVLNPGNLNKSQKGCYSKRLLSSSLADLQGGEQFWD